MLFTQRSTWPCALQATINQQKRKISRQRDILSSLKQRYAETDRKYLEENMKLTDEYKRITEQFKDLQSKFRHFELVDTKKYAEVRASLQHVIDCQICCAFLPWQMLLEHEDVMSHACCPA